MLKLVTILGGAVVLSGIAMSSAAAGNANNLTKAACYASIQHKCYGGGKTNCTPQEYNEGIDWCDASFADDSQGTPKKFLSATKLMLNFLTPN